MHTRIASYAALGLSLWPALARASGMGGLGEGLHDAYVDVVVPIGLVVPEYSLALRDRDLSHGLAWEIPFILQDEPRWSFGPALAWYPGAGSVAARATLRYVFIPVSDESWHTPIEDSVALALGAGAFVESRTGWGPRVELRARYMFLGVVFLSMAYEPTVVPRVMHGGELSAGFELPILL